MSAALQRIASRLAHLDRKEISDFVESYRIFRDQGEDGLASLRAALLQNKMPADDADALLELLASMATGRTWS